MKDNKKNLIYIGLGFVTLLLAVLAILIAFKLRQQGPVAPTVPQAEPKAIEGSPVPECQYSFTITLPSPTPTPSGTPSPTPTPPPGASPSPTPSATPTPTPLSSPTPTPTATPRPSVSPSPTATPSPSPTATPVPQCNDTCTTNSQCPSNLVCYIASGNTSGNCRNASCTTESDCTCDIAYASSPTPSPSVIPEVPQAGVSWPTIFMIIGGMALLVLGLALP